MIKAYIKKQERSQTNNLTLVSSLKKLEEKTLSPKLADRRKL